MDDIKDRIEKLKQQARDLSGGQMRSGVSPNCPPEMKEEFWKRVVAFENAVEIKPYELLTRSGLTPPSPEEVADATLPTTLWRVIFGLAFLGVQLHSTDHLSDRELYVLLWDDVLQEPMDFPNDWDSTWHIDFTAGGSEEDILVYLKYYANEEDRVRWAQEWPDYPMPPAERRPFDRDGDLP